MVKYNEYPDGVKPRLLKSGEVVEYELVGLRRDVMDKHGKRMAIPFITGVPNADVVRVKDKGGNESYINIAFIVAKDSTGKPTFGDIHFKQRDGGVIRLVGGKANDQKRFEFMELCNWNIDNPNRDPSQPAKFRRVDYKKRSEEKRDARKIRKEAERKAEGLSLTAVKRVYIGLGYGDLAEEGVMRDRVEDFAESNPEKFLIMSENQDYSIMEVAMEAKKKGVISVNYQKRQIISHTGEILHTWTPEKDVVWTEKFVEFAKSDNGAEFYKELITNLKAKVK